MLLQFTNKKIIDEKQTFYDVVIILLNQIN